MVDLELPTKKCSACGIEQELSLFHKSKSKKDGYCYQCKECKKAYYAAHKEEALVRARKSVEINRKKISEYQKRYYLNNRKKLLESSKKRQQNNQEEISGYKKQWAHSAAKKEEWLRRIPAPDKGEFVNGQITVECKLCSKRFAPTKQQILDRKRAWDGKEFGERNFYCSDTCSGSCPLFRFNPGYVDPKSKLYIPKTEQQEVRACQTRTLKQMQCDEVGYNYCERCGDIIDVELHHTFPVAKFGKEAINPAGHMLLCAGCHVELHKECR